MQFVDEVRVRIKAGDGGNGCIAFRREKYVPRGGPSGGDGGRGGSIILLADPQLTTLLDYRYRPIHKARRGENGRGHDQNGKDGGDLILQVPVGTIIKDSASGERLCDLDKPGMRFVVAAGGRGGLGNMNFATATRQAPRFAQPGEPGEECEIQFELKLLADVGLIGFPNAGKSTLISRISAARPKIADYPFTTLVPHLGVVGYKDHKSFVVADIPGLIEGAHEGAGLGHKFLRHVERCRVLVHLVDCGADGDGRAPVADHKKLNFELKQHSKELAKKPQILAATKVDLPVARERAALLKKALGRKTTIHLISAATGEGVAELVDRMAQAVFSPSRTKAETKPAILVPKARPPRGRAHRSTMREA
jgi:GTP-binding protein